MDIVGLLVPLLSGSPEVKAKVQGLFGQPVDHVSKCVSKLMDDIKSGPGLIDKQAQMQQRFMHIYQSGLRMGFQDWQAEIAAADCAGYPIIDVANSFAQSRGWECSVQQIQQLHSQIMPKFMERGKQIGLFKDSAPTKKSGIPQVQIKKQTKEPPWRGSTVSGNSAPVQQ